MQKSAIWRLFAGYLSLYNANMRNYLWLTLLLALLGCGATDAVPTIGSADFEPATTYQNISAETVANLSDDATLINVHIPYSGEIADTDAFIAYNTILESADLPTELDTEIVLYCESGGMSRSAAQTLIDAGYTNVKNLQGGMRAWERAGYERLFNQ